MKPLHVRLAAWGTVLALALVAATVRVGADEVYEGVNGPQRNGTTSQGRAIWLVAADGRVREVRMVWRFRCDGGVRVAPLGMTARDTGAGFDQLDRGRFRFEDRRHLAGRDGDDAEVDVLIEGDGRRGTSSAEIRLAGATCRSGPVRWTTLG